MDTRWRRRARRTGYGAFLAGGFGILAVIVVGLAFALLRSFPAAIPPLPPLVPQPITSRFADWRGAEGLPRPWQHSGIDIRARVGTPALAAADGVVLRTDRQFLAGKLIEVTHAEGFSTVYFHLSEISVAPGQVVRRGDSLGRTGISGNATTPHLHFGVCRRDDGSCGTRIGTGWDDPTRYWIEGNPCFVAGRPYPVRALRLTYPVPCGG